MMSEFKGRITEFSGVIIDHFVVANCSYGRVFFLSHCHKDHMTGLSSKQLITTLRGRSCNLYCSEVTKVLLQVDDEFKHLTPYLKSLPIEEPVLMSLPAHMHLDALKLTVTLLPAGHCPGSVMFLLQDHSHSVLYTGDFRLQADDIKHTPALHPAGRLIELDSLYLDTTFCHPRAAEIPSREESRDAVLHLIERWLANSDRHVIHLNLFMVGFEHVILGVSDKFNTKVHVSGSKVRGYNEITAVGDCVTADGSKTRVHACVPMKGKRYGSGLPCGAFNTEKDGYPKVLKVKLSAQWFLLQPSAPKGICVPFHNFYRIFHSMHASYNEIRSFVGYLQPKSIVPCVTALNDSHPMDVYGRLKDLLKDDSIHTVRDRCSHFCGQPSSNVTPNKETADNHTQWMSGDDTDSDWASPIHHHNNKTTCKFGVTTQTIARKHTGTKRSLFSSGDSSLDYLTEHGVEKDSTDHDSDLHQTPIELSFSLSDTSSHGDVNCCTSQPHPPMTSPATPNHSTNCALGNTSNDSTSPNSSTPKNTQPRPSLQVTATPTYPSPKKTCPSPATGSPSSCSLQDQQLQYAYDDVIDLTQSDDDDSDITYCSNTEDEVVYIGSAASLNPSRCGQCACDAVIACHCDNSPSSLTTVDSQCMVLPATPEHSTVRTTSIALSYHGAL